MEEKKGNNKKIIISVIVLIALMAAFAAVYFTAINPPVSGEKTITVEIVHADNTIKSVEIKTSTVYLGKALVEKNLIQGTQSSTGMFVTTADGETADWDAKQQWWCLTKGGQTVNTGVDTTPIKDGDKFELTLKVGY